MLWPTVKVLGQCDIFVGVFVNTLFHFLMIVSYAIIISHLHQYERESYTFHSQFLENCWATEIGPHANCHIQITTTHWTLKASSCPRESSRSCRTVLVDSKITGCHCHARNFIHSKLLEGYFIFTRHLHDTYNIHFLEWAGPPKDSAGFALVISSSGRPSIHLAPCWGGNFRIYNLHICWNILFEGSCVIPHSVLWTHHLHLGHILWTRFCMLLYDTQYPLSPNFYRLVYTI